MKAQDLKNSILQLAIQGKLVRQRAEEGTAIELIKQIKDEKDELIKTGKIPKERNLPIIREEEKVFELPNNWQYVRVQDVASYITDYVANGSFATLKKNTKTFKTKNYALFVRTMDLTSNFKGECSYIDKASYDFLEKSKLNGGELILPNIGGSIGKVFLMPDLNMPLSLAPNSIMIKFLHPIMNEFFSYVIQSPYGATFLRDTKGGTATPKFSKTELRNMVILLPPLEEIIRIVEKIKELMPYIDKYDLAYSKVEELNKKFPEELKKSILQYAIQGKLVKQRKEEGTAEALFQQIQFEKQKLVKEGKIKKTKALPEITEDEIPFDIPESWKWVRLGDLCEKIGSGSTPKGGKAVYKEKGIKFLRSQNIYNDGLRMDGIVFISEEQNKIGSEVKTKDLLLNITGGSIGRCAIVPDDFERANINQHVMIIRNIYLENRFYLHKVLISTYIQDMIMSVQVGVSREGLSAEKLIKFLIPLPPIEEQKRILDRMSELNSYIKK